MDVKFEQIGLYNVSEEYLRYLNKIEPEVQYSEDKEYGQKPFLGIIVLIYTSNMYFEYAGLMIYAVAAYTFYRLILAIYNILVL